MVNENSFNFPVVAIDGNKHGVIIMRGMLDESSSEKVIMVSGVGHLPLVSASERVSTLRHYYKIDLS